MMQVTLCDAVSVLGMSRHKVMPYTEQEWTSNVLVMLMFDVRLEEKKTPQTNLDRSKCEHSVVKKQVGDSGASGKACSSCSLSF